MRKNKWRIPSGVVEVVKSLCRDYDRREKAAGDEAVAENNKRINTAIDEALESVEVGIRRDILHDVSNGVGYDMSQASPYMAKNTYYDRKRKVIHDIAKKLNLI